jgi:hypothetical protein
MFSQGDSLRLLSQYDAASSLAYGSERVRTLTLSDMDGFLIDFRAIWLPSTAMGT